MGLDLLTLVSLNIHYRNLHLYPPVNVSPPASSLPHSLASRLPSESMASVLPYHGSIHTKGTPFHAADHNPKTGALNITSTTGSQSLLKLTFLIPLFSTIRASLSKNSFVIVTLLFTSVR